MQVQQRPIPDHLQAAMPELTKDVLDYLSLEESEEFSSDQLSIVGYFVVDDRQCFLVFQYDAKDGPEIAFVMHALNSKRLEDCAIGSWAIADGTSIESALAEFLEYNPHFK